jgi:hypothetical protein
MYTIWQPCIRVMWHLSPPFTSNMYFFQMPMVRGRIKSRKFVWSTFFSVFILSPDSGKEQGCQTAYFQTENTNLGKFWRVLQWKTLVHLWPFGLFYCHLIYFVIIQYISWLLGNLFLVWHVVPRKIWQPWQRAGAERYLYRTRIKLNLVRSFIVIQFSTIILHLNSNKRGRRTRSNGFRSKHLLFSNSNCSKYLF